MSEWRDIDRPDVWRSFVKAHEFDEWEIVRLADMPPAKTKLQRVFDALELPPENFSDPLVWAKTVNYMAQSMTDPDEQLEHLNRCVEQLQKQVTGIAQAEYLVRLHTVDQRFIAWLGGFSVRWSSGPGIFIDMYAGQPDKKAKGTDGYIPRLLVPTAQISVDKVASLVPYGLK